MTNLFIPGDGSVIANHHFMRDQADDIAEGFRYDRTLSDDEILDERQTFSDLSIEVADLEFIKSEYLANINAQIKAKKEEAKVSLNIIRRGKMEVVETVYFIKDLSENRLGTYNAKGEIIAERPLKASERQLKMPFNENENQNLTFKTGTHD